MAKHLFKSISSYIYIYSLSGTGPFGGSCQIHGPVPLPHSESEDLSTDIDVGEIKSPVMKNPAYSHINCPPEVHKSCFCVRFIAEHTKMLEDSTKVNGFSVLCSPKKIHHFIVK